MAVVILMFVILVIGAGDCDGGDGGGGDYGVDFGDGVDEEDDDGDGGGDANYGVDDGGDGDEDDLHGSYVFYIATHALVVDDK